jgi:ribosomal protein S18 acetylase RimI-like enzyme
MVELRAATPLDAGATGDILWRALQEDAHTDDTTAAEAISFCGEMIDRNWVTVARQGASVLGFLARDGQEICALYTAPRARGQGIGRRLIEDAKQQVARLYLQAALSNPDVQRFYRSAGFVQAAVSDLRYGYEQEAPGMTFVWQKEAAA